MAPIATIGIDPGNTGAMALLVDGRFEAVIDFDEGECLAAVQEWTFFYDVRLAVLEQAQAMPKQGVSSTFAFGANFGWWEGVLAGVGVPYRTVRPAEWMKGLVPRKKKPTDKPGLALTRRLMPTAPLPLQKHHNRADAILLAYWGYMQIVATGGR